MTLREVDTVLGAAEDQLNKNLLYQTNIPENVIMSEHSQIGIPAQNTSCIVDDRQITSV